MNAFLYVLRCNGGKYYVGSTEDLERRMKEHAAGRGCAFTKAHLPFELVYTEENPSYESAYERERQVHKWSRAKKERLIKGELPYMRHLSTNAQDPAIDMGDRSPRDSKGYRVPADNRTSISTNSITTTTSTAAEQGRSITEGDQKRCELSEFNSDNTRRLNVEETKAKIASLEYIQNELKGIDNIAK